MIDLETPLLRRTTSLYFDARNRPSFLPLSMSQCELNANLKPQSLSSKCFSYMGWALLALLAALSIAERPWKSHPSQRLVERLFFPELQALGPEAFDVVRNTASIVCFIVNLLPALCLAVLSLWYWAELPGIECEGLELARKVKCIMLSSWALSCVMAIDDSMAARCAAMAYVPLLIGLGIYRCLSNILVLRMKRLLGLVIPMTLKYYMHLWWAKRVHLPEEAQASALQKLHEVYSERCFEVAVEFGGIWIKEGQKLAGLPLGLPPQYEAQMKKCTNAVPPRSAESIKECIARSYGQSVDRVFRSFEEKPLGAASIGQVHRATLADGREVVVKVQYPEIKETLQFDLSMLTRVMRFVQGEAGAKMMEEFKRIMLDELDFMNEVRNMDRVRANLENTFPAINVPEPVHELCRSTVLVMTMVPGVSLMDAALRMVQVLAKLCGMGDMKMEDMMQEVVKGAVPGQISSDSAEQTAQRSRLKELVLCLYNHIPESHKARVVEHMFTAGRAAARLGTVLYNNSAVHFGQKPIEAMPRFDMARLSQTIWDVFGHQVFVDGFCSADSHPGNILVDVDTGALSLIDFGNALEIPIGLRVKLARLLVAIAEGTDGEIAQAVAQLGMRTPNMGSDNFALLAKVYFGQVPFTDNFVGKMMQVKEEEGGDATYEDDKALVLVVAISLIRISSLCLGTVRTLYPAVVWLGLARQVLEQYGSEYPAGSPISMDIKSPTKQSERRTLAEIPREEFKTASWDE